MTTKEVRYKTSPTTDYETAVEILDFFGDELMYNRTDLEKYGEYRNGLVFLKNYIQSLRDNQCVCD